MKNKNLLKTEKTASYSRWIIAAATILLLSVSLSFEGHAQQNYLPPGVESPKADYRVFWDMYFDADFAKTYANQIEYTLTGKDKPYMKTGDYIIHGDYETGFCGYKVDEIDTGVPDKLILKVHQFSFAELVPEADIKSMPVDKDRLLYERIEYATGEVEITTTDERFYNKSVVNNPNLKMIIPNKGGTNYSPGAIHILNYVNLPIYSDSIEHNEEGEPYEYSGALTVSMPTAQWSYIPTIDLGWEYQWDGLTPVPVSAYYIFSTDMNMHADVRVEIAAAGSYYVSRKIFTKKCLFTIGPIPVTLNIKVTGILEAEASATGYTQAGFQINGTGAQKGASWTKTGGWTDTDIPGVLSYDKYNSDPASVNNKLTYNLEGDIGATLRLEPEFSIMILDAAGPKITPAPYLKFDVNYSSVNNFSWGLYAGLKCDLDFELKVPVVDFSIWQYRKTLFNKSWLLFPLPGDETGSYSGDGGGKGNQPGYEDDDIDGTYGAPCIEVPNLISPADRAFTNDLTPNFTWSPVIGATKYQLVVGTKIFETTETSFTPSEQLRSKTGASWYVRAYKAGRYGKASDTRWVDIGLTIGSGNSFYSTLYLGQQYIVTDPYSGQDFTFRFYDIENSGEVWIKVFNSSGDEVEGIFLFEGDAKKSVSAKGLFVYMSNVFNAQDKLGQFIIAPYVLPSVEITSPAGGTINDAFVNLSLTYSGYNVTHTGESDFPLVHVSNLRTLSYNGTAGADANYYWTNDGTAGERTLTVELTDMFGNKITDNVTVQFDPTLPNYVFRGPMGDDWKTFNIWYYHSGYAKYMRIDAVNNAGEHQQQNDCWYVCPSDIWGPSPWCTTEEAMIHVAEYLKHLTDGTGNYGSEMIPYGLPTGSIGIFVVDKNQYENESFTIPCTNATVTYFDLYNEAARQLGKDNNGFHRVWASGSAATRNPADAIKPPYPFDDYEPVASPNSGILPLKVSFTCEATYLNENEIVSYLWDFDNGSTSELQNLLYTYNATGTYNVTLTVTNSEGETATNSLTVIAEINNYGFETGSFSEWEVVGGYASISSGDPKIGNYKAYVGRGSRIGGTTTIIKVVTIPSDATTLKYYAKRWKTERYGASASVKIIDNGVSTTYGIPIADWQQYTHNISEFAGKTVTLQLHIYHHGASDNSVYVYWDDIRFDSELPAKISSEKFEVGFSEWVNTGDDDRDWTRLSGKTSSRGTGPSGAVEGSYYVYTEASGSGNPYKTFILLGPTIDFDFYTDEKIIFYYHLRASSAFQGHIYLEENTTGSWVSLWSKRRNTYETNNFSWIKYEVDLSALSGVGTLRFRAVTGGSYENDMALDAIEIFGTPVGFKFYPIAKYHMDENAGTTAHDATSNNNDGTIHGATWTDGKIGSTLSFDGVNDYVSVPADNTLNTSHYTVEAWIKPNGVPNETWKGIIGKPGRNYNIWLHNSGMIHHRFHTSGNWNTGAPNTPAGSITWNAWNHVVITNDGITAKTYINGVEKACGLSGGDQITDNTPLYIGRNLDGGSSNYFNGLIDEVTIYNRVLTAAEILDNYNIDNSGNKSTNNTGKEETVTEISQAEETGRLLVYPNPMLNELSIKYDVQSAGIVTIDVYDITGRLVQSLTGSYTLPGKHTVQWNANDTKGSKMPNGTYFIRMQTKNNAQTTKVILMR